MSQKGEKDSDIKLENDKIWCTFVTNRVKMGKRITDTDQIRAALKKVVNPFSNELVIQVDVRLSPDAKIVDPVYGEIPAWTEIEKAKATKVYKTAELRNQTMNLSATAMRMLWFITYEMEGSDDWVELDPEWYKEVSQAGSRNMYSKGKEELVRYGYISRTEYKNIYWVNPKIIYGGNRITKYPTKVEVKNTFTGKPVSRRRSKPPMENKGSIRITRKTRTTMDEKNNEVNTVEI